MWYLVVSICRTATYLLWCRLPTGGASRLGRSSEHYYVDRLVGWLILCAGDITHLCSVLRPETSPYDYLHQQYRGMPQDVAVALATAYSGM